ncbi:hypothetical protein B0H10DRAFT_1953227 [Mycena sp. CBHHK59/15]|nr:hypothetical protein B0H10DRAFT_1953227 [Mycena sp. CBHHK59/15]
MQVPPKDAVFSGSSLPPKCFKELMVGLRPRIAELPRQTIALHIGQYDQWRLRLPTEDRAKAPRLKVAAPRQVEAHPQVLVFHDPSKKIDYNNYDLSLDKVFFWARWVPFSGDDQIDCPQDHPELWQELPEDIARRTSC